MRMVTTTAMNDNNNEKVNTNRKRKINESNIRSEINESNIRSSINSNVKNRNLNNRTNAMRVSKNNLNNSSQQRKKPINKIKQ